MTPDKSTMNKTELRFEQAIKENVSGYQLVNDDDPIEIAGIEAAAKNCYQLHRKEAIRFADWIRDNVVLDGAPKGYYRLTKERKTMDELFDLFTSSNEGNNEKE